MLERIQRETGKSIWTILQLRLHPKIISLKEKVDNDNRKLISEKEKLEQLRWLQNNYKIHFKKSIYDVISVNSKEDLLDL